MGAIAASGARPGAAMPKCRFPSHVIDYNDAKIAVQSSACLPLSPDGKERAGRAA